MKPYWNTLYNTIVIQKKFRSTRNLIKDSYKADSLSNFKQETKGYKEKKKVQKLINNKN